MKQEQSAILQGTLDLLILKSLLAGKMYGLGVSRRIQAFFRSSPARSFPRCTAWRKRAGFPRFGQIPKTTAAQNIID